MPGGELALEPFTGHAPSHPVKPVVEGVCDDVRAKVPSRMSCQRQIWQMGPGILEVLILSFAPFAEPCIANYRTRLLHKGKSFVPPIGFHVVASSKAFCSVKF